MTGIHRLRYLVNQWDTDHEPDMQNYGIRLQGLLVSLDPEVKEDIEAIQIITKALKKLYTQ